MPSVFTPKVLSSIRPSVRPQTRNVRSTAAFPTTCSKPHRSTSPHFPNLKQERNGVFGAGKMRGSARKAGSDGTGTASLLFDSDCLCRWRGGHSFVSWLVKVRCDIKRVQCVRFWEYQQLIPAKGINFNHSHFISWLNILGRDETHYRALPGPSLAGICQRLQ